MYFQMLYEECKGYPRMLILYLKLSSQLHRKGFLSSSLNGESSLEECHLKKVFSASELVTRCHCAKQKLNTVTLALGLSFWH